MTVAEALLADLIARGFQLTPAGDRIIVAPASKLTDDLRARIRDNKPELLRALAPALPADLERRVRAMAARWEYTDADLTNALERARRDPGGWTRVVELDEERESEFRARGLVSRVDA